MAVTAVSQASKAAFTEGLATQIRWLARCACRPRATEITDRGGHALTKAASAAATRKGAMHAMAARVISDKVSPAMHSQRSATRYRVAAPACTAAQTSVRSRCGVAMVTHHMCAVLRGQAVDAAVTRQQHCAFMRRGRGPGVVSSASAGGGARPPWQAMAPWPHSL